MLRRIFDRWRCRGEPCVPGPRLVPRPAGCSAAAALLVRAVRRRSCWARGRAGLLLLGHRRAWRRWCCARADAFDVERAGAAGAPPGRARERDPRRALTTPPRDRCGSRCARSGRALLEQPLQRRRGRCRPGEVLTLRAAGARGRARARDASRRRSRPLTLLGPRAEQRLARAGAWREVCVLPNLRAVGRLHAQLNRFFLRGLGSRSSARLGKGRDFDRLREYVLGDDYRDMAWKASARRAQADRPRVPARPLAGHADLPRPRPPHGRARGARHALDHAVNAAVLLAYICNRMEDRVGILSFADDVEPGLGPGRGTTPPAPPHRLRRHRARRVPAHRLPGARPPTCAAGCGHRTLVLILTALPELEHDGARAGRAHARPAPPAAGGGALRSRPGRGGRPAALRPEAELCRTLVARDLWPGARNGARAAPPGRPGGRDPPRRRRQCRPSTPTWRSRRGSCSRGRPFGARGAPGTARCRRPCDAADAQARYAIERRRRRRARPGS